MTRVLHVLNGDALREKVVRSGLPGDTTVWADVLHDGPTPADVSEGEWRRIRARHLSRGIGDVTENSILSQLREWDEALERHAEYDELVFWVEDDLFDQLLLIRHLHWLNRTANGGTAFGLIGIENHPRVERVNGGRRLGPEQLESLMRARTPITDVQIKVGRRAWELFTASDPFALDTWRRGDTRALPFLADALRRHLEDFPWTGDGLSRSERQILRAVADGAHTLADAFRATQAMEQRPFMGDLTFLGTAHRLARARYPLISVAGENGQRPDLSAAVELTATGHDVLAGRSDHVALNGIDRWMGGVHVTDGRVRWDGEKLTTTNASEA